MKIESNLLGIIIADVTLFDILDDMVMDPILLEFSDTMIKHPFSKKINFIRMVLLSSI
jgi:hypothetical protein